MTWIVRLVKFAADGEDQSVDVMTINRPDDLSEIANLGLTLAEGKLLLAGLQQQVVAAQAGEPCPSTAGLPKLWRRLPCEGLLGPHGCDAFRPGHAAASPLSLCRVWRQRSRAWLATALPLDTGTGSASSAFLGADAVPGGR